MKHLSALLLGFSLLGCSVPWEHHATAHILIEEKDFTPEQIDVIHEAVSEWNTALNGYLRFEYVTEKGDDNLIVIRGVSLTILLQDDISAVTYTVPWENGGGIELPNSLTGDGKPYLLPLALHELGHALSLSHSGENTIMQPVLKVPTQRITCVDLSQFCEINDCNAMDFPICQSCIQSTDGI